MSSAYDQLTREQLIGLVEARTAGVGEVERLRNLIEQAADGIFVLDGAGVLLEVNEAGARMLGRSRTEMAGRPIAELIAPGETEHSALMLDRLRGGQVLSFERVFRRKDGSEFPAEVSAKQLSDGRIQGILRDITARRQAQEELRRNEERFRNLTAAAFEGIAITEGGRIVDINDQFAQMYHCTREELIGRPVTTLVAEASRPLVAERMKRGSEEPYQHRAIRKDGSEFDVEVRGRMVDWGGRRVRVTAIRDITERQQAEAARRESELRLSLIFQNAFDPLALYGVEGEGRYRLLAVNPAYLQSASQRAGCPVTEAMVVGQNLGEGMWQRLGIDEAAATRSTERLQEAATSGRIVRWEDTQTRPGGRFASERTDIPILDADGRCRLVLRVVHDVTERTQAEAERAARMERVERQASALLAYSLDPAVTGGDVRQAARRMTEMAAHTLEVERASIWLLEPDGRTLRCVDRYCRSLGRHSLEDFRLDLSRFSETLAGIVEGRVLAMDDIARDPRTRRLARELEGLARRLDEEPVRSVLTTAVRVRGQVAGVVWTATVGSAKTWHSDEPTFCAALGDHFAQALLNAEREQAARDLRTLAGQLLATEDAQRRQIARELHDSTGQLLAALEINMVMLSRAASGLDAKAKELLQDCIVQAKQCSTSIRTASYLLHPPLLDEMGLVSALQWHLDGFGRRSGIQMAADLPADFARLPPEDELSLFRIVQEALSNIHRHSGAKTGRIRLRRVDGEVRLTITDDGHGMAPESAARLGAARASPGIGLAGMRERLRQLGGRLDVHSDAGGTQLEVVLPARGAPGAPTAAAP